MKFRNLVPVILYAGSKGNTDINNRLLESVGEDKGGMILKKSFETCTVPYVK